jgi:hypothetical protein
MRAKTRTEARRRPGDAAGAAADRGGAAARHAHADGLLLTAIELLPFLLLSLPAGVWLDRVRKLPVYVVGELTLAWRRC